MSCGLGKSVGEVELGGLGALQARFEATAKGHQLIDFGDDAVLFGEWWENERKRLNLFCGYVRHAVTSPWIDRVNKRRRVQPHEEIGQIKFVVFGDRFCDSLQEEAREIELCYSCDL